MPAIGKQYFHRGIPFKQLWQIFPILKPFYTEFENDYIFENVQQWMTMNPWLPLLSVLSYMLFCYFGNRIMAHYKPFHLVKSLALWNLFLSLFSFWGAFRTVPHLLYIVSSKPFHKTICDSPLPEWGAGATGFAVQMFILSKFPELFDTFFIVMRKKPLIFLHWYHHITVLLYCWHSYVTEASIGLFFVAMNYSVHAIMYFYFFLAAIKVVPKWFPTWTITAAQISQMIVGIIVVSSAIYYHFFGLSFDPKIECSTKFSNLVAGVVMYGSYLLLFLNFAVERFLIRKPKKQTLQLSLKDESTRSSPQTSLKES